MHKLNIISFGVSVIGPSHISRNLPNQDSFLIKKFRSCTVMAVSDGVGSKPKSDIGSKAVCRAVCESVRDYFHRYANAPVKDLIRLIHARWNLEIAPSLPDECNATVLFAGFSNNCLILGRLGDGMLCTKVSGKQVFMTDDKTDSFSNITECIGGHLHFDRWDVRKFDDCIPDYIVMSTDGISDDIIPEKLPSFVESFVHEFVPMSPLLRTNTILKMFQNWPVKGHSDDKTIACLYFLPGEYR